MADTYANWLGLLKWSLAQGGDGTTDSNVKEKITEENRKFLENAMKEIMNEPERLRQIMSSLVDMLEDKAYPEFEERNEIAEGLLDELHFIIEQIGKLSLSF